ncbi:MAG TPA: polymer-forming cytoskeletal protein [Pyrinomonadaceae bacterium]|jgi:cytoskeletal protein CcmA (bactofilin family)
MFRTNRNNKPEPAAGEQAAPPTPAPVAPTPPPTPAATSVATANTPPSAPAQAAPPRAPQTPVSPALATPTQPRAVTETDALARDLKDGLVGGFVGVHSAVSGEANFKGMLRVDGRVSGRINSQDGTLIVSAGGQVDADIEVAVAKINGTVKGDIRAHGRIEFGRTARVNGNIHTPALIIEQGAIFEGNCRMTEQPAQADRPRAQAPTRTAATQQTAASGKEHKPVPAVPTTAAPARPAPTTTREGATV